MKARYLGYSGDDADESPRYVTHLGVTFRRDRWATLPAVVDDEALKQSPTAISKTQFAKLKAHPHFEVAEGEGDPIEPSDTVEAAVPAQGQAGNSGGAKLSKDEIVARLQVIANANPEFEFNAKLGAPKLAAILEQAEFEYGAD